MSHFEARVVGMHFREREGVQAKAIVANFIPPVNLQLEREPENPHDIYAIKVFYGGDHIGYIERDAASFIAIEMDEGVEFTCTVTALDDSGKTIYPLVSIQPIESD